MGICSLARAKTKRNLNHRRCVLRRLFSENGEHMTDFTIALAGKKIRICGLYDYAREYCGDYLTEGEPDVTVTVTPGDIAYEQARSAREDEVEGIPVRQFSEDYLETLAIYRKIVEKLLAYDILLFHGSAISVDGEGYLFTAKSGTGKSTHTRLWRQRFADRCITVNDDKPLLWVTQDAVLVCGTPWDGKHHLSTNTMVPLKAIVRLERGERNEIEPLSVSAAMPTLLQQSYRPSDPAALSRLLILLDRMTKKIGLYRLKCNMDPEAAQVAYDGMQRKE